MNNIVNKKDLEDFGYLKIDIRKELDISQEIKRLRREKNAVILAHYYQYNEIQDIADFVGDSLDLSRKAASTDADIIVFSGVHFMAETAKILSPDKKVLLPDLKAGCSLAEACPAKEFEKFLKKYPDHTVISYINTTAEIKALSDIICTSTNAVEIFSFVKSMTVFGIFVPPTAITFFMPYFNRLSTSLLPSTIIIASLFSIFGPAGQ